MRNLLAYWLGGMATGIAAALSLLTLLRDVAPMIFQHVAAAAAGQLPHWWRTAHHAALHAALPAVSFDRLGLPRLAG